MKSLTLTFIILSFINIPAQERYINVTGKSELIIPADQVSFSIPIKIIAESIEESKKTNDKILNELLNILH
ncbi:MAG TPA: SIMPL domain-containing protein, partial [Ignavibacteriaceae bacterium]|nr:SIMPL domain-containing protein [Ignavibacteriaceae bacterium]